MGQGRHGFERSASKSDVWRVWHQSARPFGGMLLQVLGFARETAIPEGVINGCSRNETKNADKIISFDKIHTIQLELFSPTIAR